ncbi:uncharacterized protein LOC132900385 [Neoarius graeffei]|uniref:uncharacterized protein LOC132900385 n=1 Tax=Neoarius graeffei TaxID=443677 RepID=UPI00298C7098|nr:uncharacterized protein LOC132900385 [Neoarius graeffei]
MLVAQSPDVLLCVVVGLGGWSHYPSQSVVINGTPSAPSFLMYGVPQGSVLGPLLFSLYVSPLEDIVNAHNLQTMIYADGTQLYLVTQSSERSTSIEALEYCASDIVQWMKCNKLLCNTTKTEVLHFQSWYLAVDAIQYVTVGESVKEPISEACDLGVIFDHHLKMPSQDLSKLQRIQNAAARMVTLKKKYDHITPVLRSLHWLTVKKRIIFKILLMTFKVLNGLVPSYLSDLLVVKKPLRSLRSNSNNIIVLSTPRYRTDTYGKRAFASCAPRLWNQLPKVLKESTDINDFKKGLKTFRFTYLILLVLIFELLSLDFFSL